ncbi:XdhC family protein [Nesterenkonia halotolerans]|uniref:Xanthine dehydrogenase accessory factor n=1 Tax=Nesterenkonia halotolerans TaxID=225325 RepID=A0ABR9J674_9MICC|nr:XdhC family protein [Nesterenkonia halotolerans]MBE1514493.1 xanthine dehydrogenase accessory factor [Nesterenkonia halotolerans]
MLDRITSYSSCLEDPEHWAIATIVSVHGSSPSPVGTSMAVSTDLEIIGSLSGGCVESSVAASAQDAIAAGTISRESFGPDGTPFGQAGLGIALTCGGEIEVLIQPLVTAELKTLRELASRDPHLPAELTRTVTDHAGARLHVHEQRAGAPRLILSGVHDFSVQLAQLALQIGWNVHLVEIRPAFGTAARVPAGAQLHVGHPGTVIAELLEDQSAAWTGVVVMTHHPDLDVPVLHAALSRTIRTERADDDAARCFIGAMGSRSSAARRDAALLAMGHGEAARKRVISPLGLDLGAETPAEAAVSMLAELLAAKNAQTSAQPLHLRDGPINASRPRSISIFREMAV